jgi:hypothetical protein
LEARVIVTSYNQHVRLLSPEPWLVGTTKVYSGLGADIVMESLRSKSRALRLRQPFIPSLREMSRPLLLNFFISPRNINFVADGVDVQYRCVLGPTIRTVSAI